MVLLPIRAVSSGSARGTEKHQLITFVTYVVNQLPSLFHADSRSPTTFPRSCRLVGMPISSPQRAKPHHCGADSPAQAGLLLLRLNPELLQRDEVEQSLGQAMELVQLAAVGDGPGRAPLIVKYGGEERLVMLSKLGQTERFSKYEGRQC